MIKRFHLWGLQLDIYHNKVQQYQWRQFHYTSLLVQQWPTPFKNTLLINSALSQNYKKQMKLYPLEYYYIKPWQSHTLLQSYGSPMHYIIGIIVVLCITPLESLQRHHQSCSDLTLRGLVSHYLFERTTYRST